jgi:hypothetical protein
MRVYGRRVYREKIYGPGNKALRTKMIQDMIVLMAGRGRKCMDQGTKVWRIQRTEDVTV